MLASVVFSEVFVGHVRLPWFTRDILLLVGFYSPLLLGGWKTSTDLYCFPVNVLYCVEGICVPVA